MAFDLKDLGPCQIEFNDVDLGDTKGGVKFRDTSEDRPVNTDQAGVTPVDHIDVGHSIAIEVMLTQTQLAILAPLIPGAHYTTDYIEVRNDIGAGKYDDAAELVLSPLVDGVAGDDVLTIYKAAPKVDMEVVFDSENQRVFKVLFYAYPDPDNDNRLYQLGETVE